jgi:hypothetical protein
MDPLAIAGRQHDHRADLDDAAPGDRFAGEDATATTGAVAEVEARDLREHRVR